MIAEKASARGRVEEVFRREKAGCLCQGEPITVSPDDTLAETLRQLRGDSGGGVVVVKSQGKRAKGSKKVLKPVGNFTERDYPDKIVNVGIVNVGDPKKPSGGAGSQIPLEKSLQKKSTEKNTEKKLEELPIS